MDTSNWRLRFGAAMTILCALVLIPGGNAWGQGVPIGTKGSVPQCTHATLQAGTCQSEITGYLATITDGNPVDADACASAGTGGQTTVYTCRFGASDWEEFGEGGVGGGIGSVVEDTTPQIGGTVGIDMQGQDVTSGGVVFLTEQADAEADVAGQGQVWVNTATPNELWFTDDAGTDTQLGVGGGSGDVTGPVTSTDNALPRWDGTGGDTLQDSGWAIDDAGALTGPGGAAGTSIDLYEASGGDYIRLAAPDALDATVDCRPTTHDSISDGRIPLHCQAYDRIIVQEFVVPGDGTAGTGLPTTMTFPTIAPGTGFDDVWFSAYSSDGTTQQAESNSGGLWKGLVPLGTRRQLLSLSAIVPVVSSAGTADCQIEVVAAEAGPGAHSTDTLIPNAVIELGNGSGGTSGNPTGCTGAPSASCVQVNATSSQWTQYLGDSGGTDIPNDGTGSGSSNRRASYQDGDDSGWFALRLNHRDGLNCQTSGSKSLSGIVIRLVFGDRLL